MPNREVNLGMMSLRITGSGEPATATRPSFLAAVSVSFHSFSQPLGWAHAVVATNISRPIALCIRNPFSRGVQDVQAVQIVQVVFGGSYFLNVLNDYLNGGMVFFTPVFFSSSS